MTAIDKVFLFRFDGARENNAFLERARSSGHVVYAGQAMQLQRGWIPDFIQVSVEKSPVTCSLTIIELDKTETVALENARKYLPESSEDVLTSFAQYLQRILRRCRSTADPRTQAIQDLADALRDTWRVKVYAAAGLRQPPRIVETLPLTDQGSAAPAPTLDRQIGSPAASLSGNLVLSARDHKNLSRSVLILDAVVRGRDRSDASLRAWRNLRSQPLRQQVKTHAADFPGLAALLLGQKVGVSLRLNDVARELSTIWNGFQPGQHSETSVVEAINTFLPIDRTLDPTASVRVAFAKARLAFGPR